MKHLLLSMYILWLANVQSDRSFGDRRKWLGAVVVLIKGDYTKIYDMLLRRNKAIEKYLWTDDNNFEMIIFHDKEVSSTDLQYIQSQTPRMPLKFVDVNTVFELYHEVNNPLCPNTVESLRFRPGYFSMCLFWFAYFFEYLDEYDWMLRIDDDCHLISDVKSLIPPPNDIPFSSTRWIDLATVNYDTLSVTKEGGVVRGMRALVNQFAKLHNLKSNHVTWTAPYTNVMYVNLNWLRKNSMIQDFIRVVTHSQCIYSNRWGDLPLWGAALLLTDIKPHYLNLPYEHGSHSMTVLGDRVIIHKKKKKILDWLVFTHWGGFFMV